MSDEDSELLRRYADEKSEEAFAALVRRHLDLVYSVALRQVGGDAHLAQDVAQTVFTSLARKAATLAGRPVHGGWLYRTAQFTAIDVVRAESRRRAREVEAQTMHDFSLNPNPGGAVDWEKLRPTLDQAIGELDDADRDAVVLRYFEGKSFAEVGAKLRLNENTARMRVDRALDKLHAALAQRGVTSTTAALAVALANQAGVAAPAGLAASVTGAALAGGGAAAAAGAGAWLTFMSITKVQIGIAGALAVAGATGYLVQAETNAGLRREIVATQTQVQVVTALRAENTHLSAAAAEVDTLRQDDLELKGLEQRVLELKKANEEKARVAKIESQSRRKEMENRLIQDAQMAQQEADRMNREVNKQVEEYNSLSARAKDLIGEERVQADALAAAQLIKIQNKRSEIQAFISNSVRALDQRAAVFRSLYPNELDSNNTSPPGAPADRPDLRQSPLNGNGVSDDVPRTREEVAARAKALIDAARRP